MIGWINRNNRFTRIVAFLLAIHLLNFSIDPEDPQPLHLPEDLSINEIESFAEFIAEVVLGFTDAFAETEEQDTSETTLDSSSSVHYTPPGSDNTIPGIATRVANEYFITDDIGYALLAREISSPPPEA